MKINLKEGFIVMRIVEVDLTRLQKSYFLGFTNEHLITNVHIKLNNELLEAESFSLMFSVFGSKRVVSNLQAVNGYIDYCLPRDITGIIKRKCQIEVMRVVNPYTFI